ncbi:unnamed protein product, partial [Prorocentrum cordatum]
MEELRLAQELANLQQATSEAPVQKEGLAALKSQLEAACQQLSNLEGTHPDAIADAEASLAQHAAKEAGGVNVPRRHSAKSPPMPGEDTSAPGVAPTHRHLGKQPLHPQEKKNKQQTLTNYFNLSSGIPDPGKMAPPRPRSQGPEQRWQRHCDKRARNGAQLILVTFNAQTLEPKERQQLRRIGESVTARTHYVEDFCNRHHIQLAGIQESRLPDSGLTLTAISAHAPAASAPTEEKRAFWAPLQKELAAALHQRAPVVLIDGNDDDEAAGANSNYQFALERRLAHDLQDAAELSGTMEPAWFGIPGHEKRGDHVWLGPHWHRKLHATSALQDSLYFSEREGHRAVKATVALDHSLGPRPAPSPTTSTEKLRDPKARRALEEDTSALAGELQHNATQGPDVYHAQMIEHVQDLQREHFFAPASQVPKKPWISSTSWALIKNTPGI